MRYPTFVGSSITTRGGDAKVHGPMLPVAPIELAELLLVASQADLETFDLAEPAFRLGFGNAGDEIVADVDEPCPSGRLRSEEVSTWRKHAHEYKGIRRRVRRCRWTPSVSRSGRGKRPTPPRSGFGTAPASRPSPTGAGRSPGSRQLHSQDFGAAPCCRLTRNGEMSELLANRGVTHQGDWRMDARGKNRSRTDRKGCRRGRCNRTRRPERLWRHRVPRTCRCRILSRRTLRSDAGAKCGHGRIPGAKN